MVHRGIPPKTLNQTVPHLAVLRRIVHQKRTEGKKEKRRTESLLKKVRKISKAVSKLKKHRIRIKKQQLCPQALLDDKYCPESLNLEQLLNN